MSKGKSYKDVEQEFDSFCKTVLKNKLRDYERKAKRKREREISLERLRETAEIYEEKFFVKVIEMDGDRFVVENDVLHEALRLLPEDKSRIILFYYFHGMTDKEISENLNLKRTTVRNRRYSALSSLRKILSGG